MDFWTKIEKVKNIFFQSTYIVIYVSLYFTLIIKFLISGASLMHWDIKYKFLYLSFLP